MTFDAVIIDPPWRYKSPGWLGGADRHYPTLPPEAFFEMPILEITHQDSHVWLWTVDCYLKVAEEILNAWCYRKRATFQWVKLAKRPLSQKKLREYQEQNKPYVIYDGQPYGLAWGNGYYARSDCEYLLLATRGDCKSIKQDHKARHVNKTFFAPIGEHSEKPAYAYELIRRYSPGKRLDCFARGPREGFYLWGNEAHPSAVVQIPALDEWSRWAQWTYPERRG